MWQLLSLYHKRGACCNIFLPLRSPFGAHPLQCVLIHGKAPSPHLADPCDHHEAGRVYAVDDFLQLEQLPVGDDAEYHLALVMQIPALRVQQCHPPVQLLQDGFPDLLRLAADDLHLRLGGADHHGLVQGDGGQQHEHNAVQDILRLLEGRLEQQDAHVKGVQAHGHRNPETFVQNQRRDVHAPRGSSRADHDAQRHPHPQPREQGAQQNVIRQHEIPQQPVEHLQRRRYQEGAGQGGGHESLPQHDQPQYQHAHVHQKQEARN